MLTTLFTFYIFIVMCFITIIHVYWLQGGLWPGKDYKDLVDKVLGEGDALPSAPMFMFVLIIFILMALFPLFLYYKIDIGINEYTEYILLFFSVIFAIRAVSMFIPTIGSRVTTIFLQYNRKYYAPLCATLSFSYFYLYM